MDSVSGGLAAMNQSIKAAVGANLATGEGKGFFLLRSYWFTGMIAEHLDSTGS
jgi:hypothetical protein